MPIRFFTEEINFNLKEKKKHRNWLTDFVKEEGFIIGEINYVFCSDEYLHKINIAYLGHDTYTDIITFDQSDSSEEISGDIFVSIERVIENAKQNKTGFEEELRRVIAHGILHLMGYKDKSSQDVEQMREKENNALQKY